jgi:hypothetical protein
MESFDVTITLTYRNVEAKDGAEAIDACKETMDCGYDDIKAEAHILFPIRPEE